MNLPFVSRRTHVQELRDYENECWDLRRQVRELREREKARMLCMATIEDEARENAARRRELEEETEAMRERVRLLAEDNRELRRRYDSTRVELAKVTREATSLRLMRESLEARLAAESEVEVGA